jgi:uncharacterized protein (TIGR03083 family)
MVGIVCLGNLGSALTCRGYERKSQHLKQPQLIIVIDLLPELLHELLELLSGLSADEWDRPTACSSWSVKDVALHLLGGDIGILSRKRDRFSITESVKNWDELVNLINQMNAVWIEASRRISRRLLCELLEFTGNQVIDYFQSLDPYALGEPVSWSGPDPAPIWLDLAREYTERWHHQQHIRDAVEKPGLKQAEFFAPVLDAFVRALPHAYRNVEAADRTQVALTITGASGGRWTLLKENGKWQLYLGVGEKPDAEVFIEDDVAWRVFTKGLSRAEARSKAMILGDQALGLKILDTVSIIA